MSPNHPRLTREELVAIISEFYTFLTRFYIPSSALKFPPPEGWPNITPESTKDFEKSPIVIDLIKHLPYIDEAQAHEMITNIHYKCDVVDYSTWTAQDFAEGNEPCGEMSLRDWHDEMEQEKLNREDEEADEDDDEAENDETNSEASNEEATSENDDYDQDDSGVDCDSDTSNWWDDDDPDDFSLANMIVLADGYESGGRALVLDVFKGNIHEDVIRCNLISPVNIESFFQDLREKYEKLDMVPVPGDEMYENANEESDGDDGEDEVAQYQRIYRSFGWPGEGYRKEEALCAVEKYRKEREEEEDRRRESGGV